MDGTGQGRPAGRDRASEVPPPAALRALCERIPPGRVRAVLRQTGRQSRRVRRLPAAAVVWLVIALGLFSSGDVPAIWRQIAGTLRLPPQAGPGGRPPATSAFFPARSPPAPPPPPPLF